MSFLSHLSRNAPLHLLLSIAVCSAFVSCTTPEPAWRHWAAPNAIRTLDVLSERHIRFAAAKGWVGETTDAGIQWHEQQWMAPDSTFPSFRASGWNGKAWFVASIASPGWIGRCTDFNAAPEWVHQDTSETTFFDAMAWWNPEEGLVFGDPVSGCLTLLVTRNGGTTHGAPWTAKMFLHTNQEKRGSPPPTGTLPSRETPHGCSLGERLHTVCAAQTAEGLGRPFHCPSCKAKP